MNILKDGSKNLFLAIVVSLFIGVIGVSFAFFAAGVSSEAYSSSGKTGTAPTLSDVTFSPKALAGSTNAIYPGTMNWAGASVKATKKNTGASGTYTVSYTVTATITPSAAFTKGNISYKLYETSTAVNTPVTCPAVDTTTSGLTIKQTRVCTLDATTLGKATPVKEGTLTSSNSTTVTITHDSSVVADGSAMKYYYLVATYPNDTSTDQSNDMGKTLTLNISKVEATSLEIS